MKCFSITFAPNAAAAIPNVSLGDTAFGGVVAYIFQTGDVGYVANEQHGVVVAVQDLSSKMKWGTGFNASQQLNNLSARFARAEPSLDDACHPLRSSIYDNMMINKIYVYVRACMHILLYMHTYIYMYEYTCTYIYIYPRRRDLTQVSHTLA